ncbi:hypothetical protein NDN08_001595 [Rhodosorus marinus]|uniref:FHA domain-containing protein n=1 Tax=Rhodosorus marinus TaxID=101924 RepID=A0AAV8URF1_9RHOD|nr:hypothetical protein NDN08_001595 [Rhodosorus marinus]
MLVHEMIPQGATKFVIPDWCGNSDPKFCFTVHKRTGQVCDVVEFSKDRGFLVFGRDVGCCDIFVGHASVSRQHAAVVWHKNNYCYLLDLESESGTKINGRVLEPKVPMMIYPDDKITFGKSSRLLKFSDNFEKALYEREAYLRDAPVFPEFAEDVEGNLLEGKKAISPPPPTYPTAQEAMGTDYSSEQLAAAQPPPPAEQPPPPPPPPPAHG